jgi:hypothetical protein
MAVVQEWQGPLARYAESIKSADPKIKKSLPPMAAVEVVRDARRGDPIAQAKVKMVVMLANSAGNSPDMIAARNAERNLMRAAALEEHGIKVESLVPSAVRGECLDNEIESLQGAGIEVGMGLAPLVGAGVAAIIGFIFYDMWKKKQPAIAISSLPRAAVLAPAPTPPVVTSPTVQPQRPSDMQSIAEMVKTVPDILSIFQ